MFSLFIYILSLASCGGGGGGGGGASISSDDYTTHNPSGWGGDGSPIDSDSSGSGGITVQGGTTLSITSYTYNGNNYDDIRSLTRALKNDNAQGQFEITLP